MLNFLLAFDNLTPMNWDVLKPALNFLWQGLLAIFVVIGLIIISVKLTALAIEKTTAWKKQREEEKEAQNTDETTNS
ncbi:MAG: hypothetical protein E7377_00540 [Clostridiales bacterium]|nr:hypothetical protein [Clostridiales bacterium]